MKIRTIKSIDVTLNSEMFLLIIGHRHWNLGIQFQYWGIRLMLIKWHICIHF
jgi:hypothetical protein